MQLCLLTAVPGSFKRRSRRFEDSLLDNLDSSRADPRLTKEQPASQNYPAQPAPRNAPATSQAKQRRKTLIQPQEDGNQRKESKQDTATDDWGWGYTGPTLATIGGDYEERLRAPGNSTNATQPAQQQDSEDTWGKEEEMRDWEDDEQLLDDDQPEEEAPDVTLLNSNDVVRHCNALYAEIFLLLVLHHVITSRCTGLQPIVYLYASLAGSHSEIA